MTAHVLIYRSQCAMIVSITSFTSIIVMTVLDILQCCEYFCEYLLYILKLDLIISESTNKHIAVNVPMTWMSAQHYCREKYTDLTSMKNQQEKEAIISVIDESRWWIGLSRVAWQWADQSNSSLRKWNRREPNGHGWEWCAAAGATGWYDITCDRKLSVICSSKQTNFTAISKTNCLFDLY